MLELQMEWAFRIHIIILNINQSYIKINIWRDVQQKVKKYIWEQVRFKVHMLKVILNMKVQI